MFNLRELMSFKILQGGIFTTIQDLGRYGYTHLGITNSGAMDEYAYLWSQKLLDNKNCNALEVMVGLKLKATLSTEIAVTGADLDFRINGVKKPIWQTHYIKSGDILSFDKRVSGQRAYLAVKEGFTIEKKYNSYSTTLKENIGFRLKRGDIIPFYSYRPTYEKRVQKKYIPKYNNSLTLRVLLCYQDDYFSQEQKERFFSSEYKITLQSDRMGFKLKGESITPTKGGIISEAIAFGSIQIPKDGQPIILLKERQTIGGYPKIGTVLSVDCFRLSQLPIGSKVRFEEIRIEEAQVKILNFYRLLKCHPEL
jgi:biotin-dependent carboxylase-like uncharacterized protein